MKKAIQIHQFSPATAVGDGVTSGLFVTQKLLRNIGYESNIYSAYIPPALSKKVQPVDGLASEKTDLLLVHHSMGHDHDDLITSFQCPMAMVYHNITPASFFAPDTAEHRYAKKGRQQLNQWSDLFIGAIGDSLYNSEELKDAGYANIITLPMLIEMEKFHTKTVSAPRDWGLNSSRPRLLSVGRIVENKRQHLLLEAMWYLKNHHDDITLPQLVIVGGVTSPEYEYSLKAHILKLGLEDDVLMPGKCSDEELSWLYQNSDCYWCASEHEGFCMPLIESGFFELPVISFASSNIPSTLGESGLIIEQSDPAILAATTAQLLTNNTLKQALINAGTRNLNNFQSSTLIPKLSAYLSSLNPALTIQ